MPGFWEALVAPIQRWVLILASVVVALFLWIYIHAQTPGQPGTEGVTKAPIHHATETRKEPKP